MAFARRCARASSSVATAAAAPCASRRDRLPRCRRALVRAARRRRMRAAVRGFDRAGRPDGVRHPAAGVRPDHRPGGRTAVRQVRAGAARTAPGTGGRGARPARRVALTTLADALRRRGTLGDALSRRPGPAGGRRGAHPPAGRGDRGQRRPRRRVQPRLEARGHGPRNGAGGPAGQLPHRAARGGHADPGQHAGTGGAGGERFGAFGRT